MSKVASTGPSSHSHISSTPHPAWMPPRSPLPPHRLAKIANALGISTPSPPAFNPSSPFLSSSGTSPSTSNGDVDHPWRATTPSIASAHNIGSFASSSHSKFLLHVIPPLHLSHQSDSLQLAPPPPTASGYHTQFRRGTLVALQPSLHAQLLAIAKEYALPSTVGLILYLVTPSTQTRQGSPMPFATPASPVDNQDEPGPRLSEEIWKLIWTRVLKVEREEAFALSRGSTPSPFTLGLGLDSSAQSNLRPLVIPLRTETPQPLTYPITPSSTASSLSDIRSHSKSAPLSSSSLTHSEPDTPDTSRSSHHETHDLDLPGLNSSSIIPILAKVEFDIDRRRAAWYEPWLRGRHITHVKRSDPRQSSEARSRSRLERDGDRKRGPFDLELVERMQSESSILSFTASSSSNEEGSAAEYAPLSDSMDEALEDDTTRHLTDVCHHDPLVDVFGTDADTWADMHAESQSNQREVNPNVVELALDASSFTAVHEHGQSADEMDDAQEIKDIICRMSKPPLGVSIPSPPNSKHVSSSTMTGVKKSVPPPLVLAPKETTNDVVLHTEWSSIPPSSGEGDSTVLPYASQSIGDEMRDDEELSLMELEYMRARSPAEEKRVGAVFEDLDLCLNLGEEEEYDENDPNDRRRSQYLMKAKLDEIERTLAQFSPRQLKTGDLHEDLAIKHARSKSLLALHAGAISKLSTETSDISTRGRSIDHADASEKSWPAVSYSFIANKSLQSPSSQSPRPDIPPSPPGLAVNGVSTGAPKSFVPHSRSASPNSVSAETKRRKRDLDPSMYPPPLPPSSCGRPSDMPSESPIPLSPDPFGRYPSFHESEPQSMPTYWDPVTGQLTSIPIESRPSLSSVDEGSVASTTPSSRFSADSSFSMDGGNVGKSSTPLVSVRTFKKLWRRSKSSQPSTPNGIRTSFLASSPPASSSQDQLGPPSQRGPPHAPTSTTSRSSSTRPVSPSLLPSSEKTSVRKSILKTWKSVSGATASSNAPSAPKHTERPVSNETIKPRRQSILDGEIPPTPKLAEHYLPSNHARTGSGMFERRKSIGRSKMEHLSNFSSSSQDGVVSPGTPSETSPSLQPAGSVSPARSVQSANSSYSEVDGSFATAQYELVSPPKIYPNLSYPYQTLDQD